MLRRKKIKESVSPAFAADETALKTKIEEIQKLSDPAEQLLRYKALKKSTTGTYDLSKVREPKEVIIDKSLGKGTYIGFGVGMAGFWGGLFTGIGLVATASALSGGIAIVAGAAAAVAGTFAGMGIGRRKGLSKYNKYTPEEKHATQMDALSRGIDRALERLVNDYTNSDYKDLKLKALETSPVRDKVLKEFPRVTAAFNEYAARKAETAADRAPFMKVPSSPSIPAP